MTYMPGCGLELLCKGADEYQLATVAVTVADLLEDNEQALELYVLLTMPQVCCWTLHLLFNLLFSLWECMHI